MKTMKTTLISTIILFTLSLFILLPHTAAVDTTEWNLPDGATSRLSKGWISGNITFSPDGKLLAVASTIGIWLYDADTGDEQALLTGHTERVNSVTFSSDSAILASGSSDDSVRLWDVATRTEIAKLIGHAARVNSVAFSPDGTTVASGSDDNTVRLWDVADKEQKDSIRHSEDVNSVVFSPNGKILASASDNNYAFLWDVATVTQIGELWHNYEDVYSVAFSPDGTTLASAADDSYVQLWDVATLTQKAVLSEGSEAHRVSFSPDGETIASGSPDGTVRLWNAVTGTERINLKKHDYYVRGVSFSPDSATFASASWKEIRLWDVATGTQKAALTGYNDEVHSVRFSPDGKTLATDVADASMRLWDVATGTEKIALRHNESVWGISFSPDGETIASVDGDDNLHLWDVTTGTEKAIFDNIYRYTFSPDGKTLAIARRYSVVLWDVATLTQKASFSSGEYNYSLRFSPDGKTLASANSDNSVYLWDVEALARKAELIGHTYDVYSVSFSPDGKTLASGSEDNTVRLWDLTTLREKAKLSHRNNVWSVWFSPDGTTLLSVVGGYSGWGNTIHLWDVETLTHKASLSHDATLNSYTFSPDSSTVATASEDNYVRLWDIPTGTHKATLTGHTRSVDSVSFSPDGETLASGSYDGTVLLWGFSSMRSVQITPSPVASPAIGEQLTVQVSIAAGSNVGGYQATVEFDPTALQYVESTNGDYLPEGSFFITPTVTENQITVAGTSLTSVSQKTEGALATLTFEVLAIKESILDLDDVILTDIEGEHLPLLTVSGRVVEPGPLASSAIVRITPALVDSPEIGEEFVLTAEIVGGENIADYQLNWHYDETALEYVSGEKSSYVLTGGARSGDGTLATATFRVKNLKTSTVSLSGYFTAPNGLHSIPTFESAEVVAPLFGDVNRDGVLDILDLVLVANSFGKPVPEEGSPADVNKDGIVNIVDLVKVAGALNNGTSAPTILTHAKEFNLTKSDVQQWLTQAQQLQLTDPTSLQGIRFLEQLLEALTPKETALLHNYPNPFNPETWIPYQLAKSADVSISIYAADGTLVRKLDLGHQPIGIYQSRNRAAHWNGKNDIGEPVASGVYFYTLKAGDFSATRKMLILK